jgi:hypothetical protein
LVLLGAPVMPVPRPLSRGIVLWPVVAPELSLLRGIWLCAEAIPLDTNKAAAANMTEYFLMSSFIFLLSDPETNAGTGQAFRAIRRARAQVPRCTSIVPVSRFQGTADAGADLQQARSANSERGAQRRSRLSG